MHSPDSRSASLPRYFFNVRSAAAYEPDQLGLDLADLDTAKKEAVKGARSLLAMDLRAGRPIDHQQFEVTDEAGEIVFTLRFRDVLDLPPPVGG